ncbi:hypothetical protein [Vibrio antiquarius]|uniref:hypothetical protein n=1 Tax=Vibrio antiquarius (strain Ex25) TaxID=150340 RepID=UPI002657CBA3|nr:hypothetical protein [Vibrio antiquarius]MCS0024035.1 hypothetical protein [Vibrio antiquarius]
MNSTVQLSRFRKLVHDVLAAMLQGKRFTKSELNNLIPEGMNKSADDIIRQLQSLGYIKISHQRMKDGEPPYWYVTSADIQAYLHSPEDYLESLLQQKEEASRKKARSNINAAKSRYGVAFVVDEAEAH